MDEWMSGFKTQFEAGIFLSFKGDLKFDLN